MFSVMKLNSVQPEMVRNYISISFYHGIRVKNKKTFVFLTCDSSVTSW